MDNYSILRLIAFSLIFLVGLYFYVFYPPNIDGFEAKLPGDTTQGSDGLTQEKKEESKMESNSLRCPNVLIQKGSKYYLYNSKVDKVPGVNPIMFNNLEEYTSFLEWQRAAGIRCPVLYVQNSYNAQGQREYKIRPDVNDLHGGLPPSVTSSPKRARFANLPANDYEAVQNVSIAENMMFNNDENVSDQNLVRESAYAKIVPELGLSPDPMDPNWGGDKYTQSLVDAGYYADNEVSIAIN